MRPTEYQVIIGEDVDTLKEAVTIFLEEGWELYGTPFVGNGLFCQAVIRYGALGNET